MLKLLQFNGQTVTPKDDSLWNELITEKCGAFMGVEVTSLGSNVIKVTDGRILVKGRQVIITEEDVNVQLSTDGTKKGRLLIHVDLSAETPATFQSQVADELPDLVQDDDFNESNGIYEIELAQYDVDVLAVSNFEETIYRVDGIVEVISTEEELEANTQPGRVADALITKQLNNALANIVTNYGSSTYNTLDAMIGKWISLGMLVSLSGDPDNTTFAGIKNAVNQNVHMDILSVGDEVTASDGEVYVVMHLDYKLSTYGKNVLFCKKYCLPTTNQMNPTNTNAGGFGGSAMSAYLDGDFYNNLPSDMQPYISEFTYECGVGSSTNAVQNETHKIWLPLEYNVFGAITYSAPTEASVGLAQQFDYFLTQANRVKTLGSNGVASAWWLSSPDVGPIDICGVTTAGTTIDYTAITSNGVLPCFAILAD